MHKENAALSKVRPLLTQLSGDHTWANCEMFLGPNDNEYFEEGYMSRMIKRRRIESHGNEEGGTALSKLGGSSVALPTVNGDPTQVVNGVGLDHQQQETSNEDATMTDSHFDGEGRQTHGDQGAAGNSNAQSSSSLPQDDSAAVNGQGPEDNASGPTNGDPEAFDRSKGKGKEPERTPDPGDDDVLMVDGGVRTDHNNPRPPNSHPQADEHEAASLLASLVDESFIHPIFLAPRSAHPDRNLGLPDQEAEDVRRLLQLYVQKQEEVCRGARKLYEGLLKADRRRKTVLAWSKAEAHSGPNRDMSDGEDWYDKEEWGLTEDLKKGQDEEEEDTTQTQKKTRNRTK